MTLFASFTTVSDAERAAAALLDHGARQTDLSIVAHNHDGAVELGHGESNSEAVAKHGLTTTTGADAAMGAAKGLSLGMGLGLLGALAAMLVPGVGLVVGAGALATAVAGTAAAGAVTGGLVGYLEDQGMGEEVAAQYHARIAAGGAVLALQIPSGSLDEVEGESLLLKYGAAGVFTSYPTTTQDVAPLPVAAPHVVPSEPLENLAPVTPTTISVPTNVVVTRNDPVTGAAATGYVDDATTGMRRYVRFDAGQPFYDLGIAPTPIPVATPTVVPTAVAAAEPPAAPLGAEVPTGAVTPTRSDPVTGLAVEGYVEDPVTGLRRTVRFEHGRAYYAA